MRNKLDNAIKNNLHNIHVILENYDKYKVKIRFNELQQMRIHGFFRSNRQEKIIISCINYRKMIL
ncbi:MAG: hypothetical protein K2K02_02915, partial [Ruminococcus sp.]|nr:hypothetical protein [Ruminococcus sp.]